MGGEAREQKKKMGVSCGAIALKQQRMHGGGPAFVLEAVPHSHLLSDLATA